MTAPQQPSGSPEDDSPFDQRRLDQIATGLADQFAFLYEAEPADPRVQMAGNMLNFAFQGGFTVADENHLKAGHLDELRGFRERFLEVVGEQLKSIVETMTGGHVTFFSTAFDPASRTTNMLFVLDLLPDDKGEQREAIRNWSEQVRRNARALRISHLQTRETHIALRDEMGEIRQALRDEGAGRGEASEDR